MLKRWIRNINERGIVEQNNTQSGNWEKLDYLDFRLWVLMYYNRIVTDMEYNLIYYRIIVSNK